MKRFGDIEWLYGFITVNNVYIYFVMNNIFISFVDFDKFTLCVVRRC